MKPFFNRPEQWGLSAEDQKKKPELTRREILEKSVEYGLATGAALLAPKELLRPASSPAQETPLLEQELPLPIPEEGNHKENTHPGEYDMGRLAGRRVNDLFAYYLNLPPKATVPEKLSVDFTQAMNTLWQKKIDRVQRKEPDWAVNTKKAQEVFSLVYAEKKQRGEQTFLTLSDLVNQASSVAAEINTSLAWDQLPSCTPSFKNLDQLEVQIIRTLAEKISGEMLVAYSITELMPSVKDSAMNVDMYEFLLQNAGVEFLGSIPALSDNYLSVGMFQFTSFAVYDTPQEKRGASNINQLLPQTERIPGSVIKLTTHTLQMKAAHLFAIENLAQLLSQGKRKASAAVYAYRLAALERYANSENVVGLLQYVASAHHNPVNARNAFNEWIDDDFQGSHATRANDRVEGYIRKSHGNYNQLRAIL